MEIKPKKTLKQIEIEQMAKRFLAKVDKQDNGCWLWNGCKNAAGFGVIRINHGNKYAHRWAWEIRNGKIPKGMQVQQSCGNKNCVNFNHLKLEGRYGENQNHSKLTIDEVKKIKTTPNYYGRRSELAKLYKVSLTTIDAIDQGKTWKQI